MLSVISDRVFALAAALLGGRVFLLSDVRGVRYRATRDVLFAEDFQLAVAAGDAYEVARAIVEIGMRDLRGRTILAP